MSPLRFISESTISLHTQLYTYEPKYVGYIRNNEKQLWPTLHIEFPFLSPISGIQVVRTANCSVLQNTIPVAGAIILLLCTAHTQEWRCPHDSSFSRIESKVHPRVCSLEDACSHSSTPQPSSLYSCAHPGFWCGSSTGEGEIAHYPW
jgi:hypothetical protein